MSEKYLGHEDILAKGWVYEGGFFYKWPVDTEVPEISNRPLSWRLNFVDYDRYLKIECYERNSFEWETAYMGPTSKFNMGLIMKLLKLDKEDIVPIPDLSTLSVTFPTYGIVEQLFKAHMSPSEAKPDIYLTWQFLFRAYNRANTIKLHMGCRPCYSKVFHWYNKELRQIEKDVLGNS